MRGWRLEQTQSPLGLTSSCLSYLHRSRHYSVYSPCFLCRQLVLLGVVAELESLSHRSSSLDRPPARLLLFLPAVYSFLPVILFSFHAVHLILLTQIAINLASHTYLERLVARFYRDPIPGELLHMRSQWRSCFPTYAYKCRALSKEGLTCLPS